jgi:hypothetical protein
MDTPKQNLVSNVQKIAKLALQLRAMVDEVDVLYNGGPNWKAGINQETIDAVGSFKAADLTPDQIGAVIYFAKLAKVNIETDLPAFFVLANLP